MRVCVFTATAVCVSGTLGCSVLGSIPDDSLSSCLFLFYLFSVMRVMRRPAPHPQVVILFAGVKGFIDRVDVDKVTAYEKAWLDHIKTSHSVS